MNAFEDIKIWQLARQLCDEVFLLCKTSNLQYDKVLWNQMNKSSGSIKDNIAEGFERNTNKEFIYFLYISKASAGEVRSQLYIALDLGYLEEKEFIILKEKIENISKMLSGFIKYLKK